MIRIIRSILYSRSHKTSTLETRTCCYTSPISFIWWICGRSNWNISKWCFYKVQNIINNIIIARNFSYKSSRPISRQDSSQPRSTNSNGICTSNTYTFYLHNLITNLNNIRSKERCNSAKFNYIINRLNSISKYCCYCCRYNRRLNNIVNSNNNFSILICCYESMRSSNTNTFKIYNYWYRFECIFCTGCNFN